VVHGHGKVLCTLGEGYRGVVNRDGEVLELEQLHLVEVEFEVVG
jgi:hypothetical protein